MKTGSSSAHQHGFNFEKLMGTEIGRASDVKTSDYYTETSAFTSDVQNVTNV